jgi:Tfp pilus assembly protein PilO
MEDEKIIIDTGDDSVLPQLPVELVVARRPRKVYAGMWGSAEIAAVAVSSMALLAAVLVYLLIVVPSNAEVARNRSEADRLQVELSSANSKYGEITSTKDQVGKLLTSVDDFETRFLPPAATGQPALYQRLNGLISAYGLTNTTGPDYAPLDTADQKVANQTDEQRGREKFRSLFPGVYVTVTLEGSYQNLRRFIREIETGNEFVVISSIELEPSETDQKKPPIGAPPAQTASAAGATRPVIDPADPMAGMNASSNPGMTAQQTAAAPAVKGKTHGEVVSLRLEMASYFRRANYAPMSSPDVQTAK